METMTNETAHEKVFFAFLAWILQAADPLRSSPNVSGKGVEAGSKDTIPAKKVPGQAAARIIISGTSFP